VDAQLWRDRTALVDQAAASRYSLLPHDTQCRSHNKSDVRSKRAMATWENKAWRNWAASRDLEGRSADKAAG